MGIKKLSKCLFVLILTFYAHPGFGQGNVPVGINYQAVARDNSGKELISKNIDVKFSILSGNPLGTLEYQELHSNVITSKFGVFSLVIGKGDPTGGTVSSLSQVSWSQALHYLKVEVKFDNVFIEMGTMQFLSVPYALYAQKSLEPGPQGLKGDTGAQGPQGVQGQKGDQGDPASDNQTLSFDGANLSISVGNAGAVSTVNLTSLNVPNIMSINGDTLSITGGSKVTLPNEIQNLSLGIDNFLKISKTTGPGIDLTRFLDDKQQLIFNNADSTLTITNGTNPPISFSKYNQKLTFTPADLKLAISGGTSVVDLSPIKNAALQNLTLSGTDLSLTQSAVKIDMTPYVNTDNQTLTYTEADRSLSITNGGGPVTLGSIVAFRAGINASYNITNDIPIPLHFDQFPDLLFYYDESNYTTSSGTFKAPYNGIYSFFVSVNLSSGNSSVIIKLNGATFETIIAQTSSSGYFRGSISMKLNINDTVNAFLVQSSGYLLAPFIVTGTFAGYRVF